MDSMLSGLIPFSPLPPSSPAPDTPGQLSNPPPSPQPIASPAHPSAPPSSDGVIFSSPIRGNTREELIQARRRKGQKKRRVTLVQRQAEVDHIAKEQLVAEAAYEQAFQAGLENETAKRAELIKRELFLRILELLKEEDLCWGDFVLHISDPHSKLGRERYDGLFAKPTLVTKILDFATGQQVVHDWILAYVGQVISQEGNRATKDGLLQSRKKILDEAFVLGFDLHEIYARLRTLCPWMSSRVGASMIDMLGERSQNNSYMKHVLGLYMYATGASRQLLSVLAHLGICSSYPTLAEHGQAGDSAGGSMSEEAKKQEDAITLPLPERGAGLLKRLSNACLRTIRTIAQDRPLGAVYDNINMIVGRKDSQENGTCATIENAALRKNLHHTILRCIVLFGGEPFARFREDVFRSTPSTSLKIPLHKTDIYPLPAMNIDESSTTGNAEVMETMFRELGFDMNTPTFGDSVHLVFGDQLSIARHDSPSQSFASTAFGPGWFHHQMAATHGLIETHWGDASAGGRNPGSLAFFNSVLDRKPIVLSSLPPYRTLLYASIFDSLELISECETLQDYAEKVTFAQLEQHAMDILDQFANPAVAHRLRRSRQAEVLKSQQTGDDGIPAGSVTQGDMVFENAALFMRDALILRDFTDAIKAGDSGRIITIVKVLALSYRGSGRTKYAHELLFLVHNLTHVWPKPLRYVSLFVCGHHQ
ncbi:hypothetical protein B0H21DRAFT_780573 [Amylocystis lapponica]|nr:hypothetical protein B0H21DRAFT_780573 [Amylocystis lapponica]